MDPIQFSLSVAITNGLVTVFNKVFPEFRKFGPIVALQVGIISYLSLAGFTFPNAMYGIVSALTAIGAFSGTRSVAKGVVEMAN